MSPHFKKIRNGGHLNKLRMDQDQGKRIFIKMQLVSWNTPMLTREVYGHLPIRSAKKPTQEMRDIRHTTKDGYTEGETEDLVELTEGIGRGYGHPADGNRNPVESNTVTHPSAERAAVFLFLRALDIPADRSERRVGEKNIRESINGAVKKIKNILINTPQNVFSVSTL